MALSFKSAWESTVTWLATHPLWGRFLTGFALGFLAGLLAVAIL